MVDALKAAALLSTVLATAYVIVAPVQAHRFVETGIWRLLWVRWPLTLLLAVGFGLMTDYGVRELLTWLPRSWGGFTEDGDFVPHRDGIAGLIGLAGAVGFPYLLWDAAERAHKLYDLEHMHTVWRRLPELSAKELAELVDAFTKGAEQMPSGSGLTYIYSVLRDERDSKEFVKYLLGVKRCSAKH